MTPRLYSYWRSSAAYRVRIALNIKGIEHDIVPVSLIASGGEHRSDDYRARNPQMMLPFYEDGDIASGQSQAIIEYLEETVPEPPLLPRTPGERLAVRAFANLICCDIHPVNNLRVMQYLEREFGIQQPARDDWYRHWMQVGFTAAERLVSRDADFAFGDAPSLADVCLVPQMYNARRFALPLDAFPRLLAIDAACRELEAFRRAAPEAQPDAA